MRGDGIFCFCQGKKSTILCYMSITQIIESMRITFKRSQRKHIRKFLSGFHGKERTDLYNVFTAVAYLVYTGCQWKMLPRYYPPPGTVYYHFRKWSESTNLVARKLSATMSELRTLSVVGTGNDIYCRDTFYAPLLLTNCPTLCFTYFFDGTKVTFAPATRWRFSSSLSVTMEPHRSLKS